MRKDPWGNILWRWVREMSPLEAILLSLLESKTRQSGKDWIRISREYIQMVLGWNYQQQARTLAKLKEKGCIAVRMKGSPAKRYIKVRDVRNEITMSDLKSETALYSIDKENTQGENDVRRLFEEFDEDKTTKKSKPTKFDREVAIVIMKTLQEKERLTGPRSIHRWANSIRLLRTKDGVTENEIKEVLHWWKKHSQDQYTPKIHDGDSFREKYTRLEQAMKRSGVSIKEISEDTKQIVARLSHLSWPKGSKEKLAIMVEDTFQHLSLFRRRLKLLPFALEAMEVKMLSSIRLSKRILQEWSGRGFVETWWKEVHKQIESWEKWSGDLSMFQFKKENEAVNRKGKQLAQTYCQDERQWTLLIDLLDEHIH